MQRFVSIFTKQLQEAIEIGNSSQLKPTSKTITNIVISGLGGSGIGGKIVSQLVEKKLTVPTVINNTYTLPTFANENTLVIISSYSGNTEETVSTLKKAIKKGCEVACITSGGEVEGLAKTHNLNYTIVPGGNPPRSMLTYSLVQQFFILNNYNLIDKSFLTDLNNTISLLNEKEENIKKEAKEVASKIFGTMLAIYADSNYEGVTVRFKQQINENSKVLCSNNVIPEMNHNELVGWAGGSNNYSAIFLRNDNDFKRNQIRIEASKEIISQYTDKVIEIYSQGNSITERTLYLILITDWVSVYLAELRNVDPIEVDVITSLKNKLSNF
jgi:glucose/mannose-6-phosphate isomerase